MANCSRKAVIVGISGCSSSGKTTLARLLRDIFPNSFILHEDDFYKEDKEIPIKVDNLADWDCPEAIVLPDMVKALTYIRSHGTLPPDLKSKEDKNSIGVCPVSDSKIADLRAKVATWMQPTHPGYHALSQRKHNLQEGLNGSNLSICFLDGFLLYTQEMQAVMDLIDIRMFLRVSRPKATARRKARDGYVTLDSFWKDPPGYMDKIVWPNYVEMHKWLFRNGDVEGEPNGTLLQENGILTQLDKGVDVDMETTLDWATQELMHSLETFST